VIVVESLTKDFGTVRAVDQLSFRVEPGNVTGFLGPNGAGKTTTLRVLLGLVSPTSGTATIDGRRYADLPDPMRMVGASLEASSFHPGRTARDHLRILALSAGIPASRADDAIAQVALTEAADRRVGGYSLGMRQRLALAAALLGDPQVLLLDEPSNGLDPEGIAWLRGFLRHFASQGRTVLVSSHVLAEVQQTVDHVVIISRGRLVTSSPLAALTQNHAAEVRVRTPDADRLQAALEAQGAQVTTADSMLHVSGLSPAEIGHTALREAVELHELVQEESDLEQVFLALTDEEAQP
jgi:ABC-2 type transport system ATP-binding protein